VSKTIPQLQKCISRQPNIAKLYSRCHSAWEVLKFHSIIEHQINIDDLKGRITAAIPTFTPGMQPKSVE